MSNGTADDANSLMKRMEALRNTADQEVSALQHEVDRLTDWKEYVRSYPAIAIGAVALTAFVISARLSKSKRSNSTNANTLESVAHFTAPNFSARKASLGSALSSMVLSAAGNVLKRQAASVVASFVSGLTEARQSNSDQSNSDQSKGLDI
jgi:hypothetical protein